MTLEHRKIQARHVWLTFITLSCVLSRFRHGCCLLESNFDRTLQVFGSLEPLPAGERGHLCYSCCHPFFVFSSAFWNLMPRGLFLCYCAPCRSITSDLFPRTRGTFCWTLAIWLQMTCPTMMKKVRLWKPSSWSLSMSFHCHISHFIHFIHC